MEACICKALCNLRQFCLILITDGNQNGAAHGQLCLCCLLCLEEGFAVEFGKPKHLACGAHFGPQNRVNLLEHIEGEYGFLHAVVRNILFLQIGYGRGSACQLACDDIDCQRNHADVADLGNQRNGTGCSGVCFQHIYFIVFDGILHIHQPLNAHFLCDFSGVFLDGFDILFRNMSGRNDACGVTGVYACKLDMLHNSRNKGMCAVTDGICFTFHCVIQEAVNQNGSVGVTPTAAFMYFVRFSGSYTTSIPRPPRT